MTELFSELFRRALSEGPQRITRQGKDLVVMLEEQYEKLMGKSHQPTRLVDFFRESPLVGLELALKRQPDVEHDVEL